jgi:biopolymer transport protein ExbD
MTEKHDLFTKTGGGQIRGDINVTPLVDVCLVLLIIFMVVTPMLQEGVAVDLPEIQEPEKMPESAKQLTISIKGDGTVFVGDTWVTKEMLPRTLSEIHARSPEKDVVMKAHRALKYKNVREVMKQLNEAGFTNVGLVTLKRQAAAS